MAIHKSTRRKSTPLVKEIISAINECDITKRRLRRLLPRVQAAERLANLVLEVDPGLAASNPDDYREIVKQVKGRLPRNRRRFNDAELRDRFARSATTEGAVASGRVRTLPK